MFTIQRIQFVALAGAFGGKLYSTFDGCSGAYRSAEIGCIIFTTIYCRALL